MIIYTDFTDNLEAKYKGGYLFIGIYLVNMAVNFIVIIIQTLRIIKRKIQAFLFRRKLAKLTFANNQRSLVYLHNDNRQTISAILKSKS